MKVSYFFCTNGSKFKLLKDHNYFACLLKFEECSFFSNGSELKFNYICAV